MVLLCHVFVAKICSVMCLGANQVIYSACYQFKSTTTFNFCFSSWSKWCRRFLMLKSKKTKNVLLILLKLCVPTYYRLAYLALEFYSWFAYCWCDYYKWQLHYAAYDWVHGCWSSFWWWLLWWCRHCFASDDVLLLFL